MPAQGQDVARMQARQIELQGVAVTGLPTRSHGDVTLSKSRLCSSMQLCSLGEVNARCCGNAFKSTASRDTPTSDAGAERIFPGTARDGGFGTGTGIFKEWERECGALIQWPFDLPSKPVLFTRFFHEAWSAWMSFKAVSAP
mmetsp:Transcript_19171/g.55040  ORF Transcript_19171/g.55040 Transcript_19171/m.55040 type:complete len:142 (-) Transcript_19171:1419-1844(-)